MKNDGFIYKPYGNEEGWRVGDLVMFDPFAGRYAEWFGGRMAEIESMAYASDGKLHFRVRWLVPVPYHGRVATISDFGASNFVKPE